MMKHNIRASNGKSHLTAWKNMNKNFLVENDEIHQNNS